MNRPVLAGALGLVLLSGTPASTAQSGGPYAVRLNTIDSGGATFSIGSTYRLGGTVGQPDAGMLTGSNMTLLGGFWSALVPFPSSTPTVPTATLTATLTLIATRTPTQTLVATPTLTRIPTPAVSQTPTRPSPTVTPPPTVIPSASATPTPSVAPTPACVGDCNGDTTVTVDELLTMVDVALGNAAVTECSTGDGNHDGFITVDEILTATTNALNGCSVEGAPLPSARYSRAGLAAADELASGGAVWTRFALASFHF